MAAKQNKKTGEGLKRTMCEVMNYEPYLTMDDVMKILAAKVADGTLSQYVVIRHDKDVVSDNDVEKAPYLQLGPFHISMHF